MHAIGAAQWRFRNWYSDNWAAQLYAERTYWLSDVEVDHGETKGPRYDVSYEHATLVTPLVREGRRRLCAWLGGANASFAPCAMERFGTPADPPAPPSPPPPPPPAAERNATHNESASLLAAFAATAARFRGGNHATAFAAGRAERRERLQRAVKAWDEERRAEVS